MNTGGNGDDELYVDWFMDSWPHVHGYGGNDRIYVTTPYGHQFPSLKIFGGTGIDTIVASGKFLTGAPSGTTETNGFAIQHDYPNDFATEYHEVERLELYGTAADNGWMFTGSTSDKLTFYGSGTAGLFRTNAGDDVVTLTSGAFIHAVILELGPGEDLADLTSLSVQSVPVSAYGEDGQDLLIGGINVDRLVGGNGSDRLFGRAGADHLIGGIEEGADDSTDWADYAQEGGGGAVAVNLSAGEETVNGLLLSAMTARDTLGFVDILAGIEAASGSDSDDGFVGSEGANVFSGYGGSDRIEGRGGDDRLTGGAGDDLLIGGDGVDMADFAPEPGTGAILVNLRSSAVTAAGGLVVAAGSARDGSGNSDSLSEIEQVRTGSADDSVWGDGAANLIETRAGNDFLAGGGGMDILAGGLGDDVYEILASDSPLFQDVIVELAGEGRDEIRTDLAALSLVDFAHVENLTATGGRADLRGNALDNRLRSGSGNDFLRLQDGGADLAEGGAGNDAFYFGASWGEGDSADGGAGRDQLALQGNYTMTLASLTGVEDLILLSGSDARFGDQAGNSYAYSLTSADSVVAAGRNLLVDATMLGSGESFTFDGSAETDGSFTLSAGGGTDVMRGGARSDGFFFRSEAYFGVADRVIGDASDQIGLRGNFTGAARLVLGAEQIQGVETIVLMSGLDIRFGPITPPTGFDVTLHDGNVAKGRRFTVDGAQLHSTETMRIDGSAELDGWFRMFGGDGADELLGGAGNDGLRGNGGGDRLAGGGGTDSFAYRSAAESTGSGFDTLIDFNSGKDLIDLPVAVAGWASPVAGGRLDSASFDADLASALDGALGARQAILFTAGHGSFAGRSFLVVDGDGDGSYAAGADYVFELGADALVDLSGTAFFV